MFVMLIQTIAGFNRMNYRTFMKPHKRRILQISKFLVKIIVPIAGTPVSEQRQ